MIRIRHLKNDTGLIPLTTNPNYLLVKIYAGLLVLFMIFTVERASHSLTAPIITHLGIDHDFITTAFIRK